MKKYMSIGFSLTFTTAFILAIFIFPDACSSGIKDGLKLITNIIIPSLFPFLFICNFALNSGLSNRIGNLLKKPNSFLFHMPSCTACTIIMSMLGGYPVGGKMVSSLYENNQITKKQAECLLIYCVNPGPAFTIHAVGICILKNINLGIIIYIAITLSSLLIGIIVGLFCKKEKNKNSSIIEQPHTLIDSYVISVAHASSSMYGICGWLLIFSCFISIIFALPINDTIKSISACVLECSRGVSEGVKFGVAFMSALLAWGGISVQCQLMPNILSTKIRPLVFITGRLIHAILSFILTTIILKIFPQTISVFSNASNSLTTSFSVSIPTCIALFIMSIVLILDIDRRQKI